MKRTERDKPATDPERIKMADFGKDHWSLLAYFGCRAVDNGGIPNFDHMRANPENHPHYVGPNIMRGIRAGLPAWEEDHGTRLRGFWRDDGTTDSSRQLPDHDDWDCAFDIEAEGLIKIEGTGLLPVIRLTPIGFEIERQLREHKAAGKCSFP